MTNEMRHDFAKGDRVAVTINGKTGRYPVFAAFDDLLVLATGAGVMTLHYHLALGAWTKGGIKIEIKLEERANR